MQDCSLLLAYDSTTIYQACLIEMPSLLLCPNGTDRVMRCGAHKITSVVTNAKIASEYIKNCFNGKTNNMLKKEKQNNDLRNISYFNDGLNHIRYSGLALKCIDSQSSNDPIAKKSFCWASYDFLDSLLKWFLVRLFKKIRLPIFVQNPRYIWDLNEAKKNFDQVCELQQAFFVKKKMKKADFKRLHEEAIKYENIAALKTR